VLRLLLILIQASIRSQMQYRASFVLLSAGQFLAVGADFIALWALFDRFGRLPHWTLPQIALLYGMVSLAFALAEMAGRAFDQFGPLVKSGDFDRILVRPWPTALLLAGQTFELSRLGRIAVGVVALSWGCLNAGVVWSLPKAAMLLGAVLGGAATFYGVLVLQATVCFWTVESLEVVNAVTYGGITAAQMPLTIYPTPLRWFFTFVVPLACVNYIPADALLDRSDLPAWIPWATPWIGAAFLVAAFAVWRLGERHYTSAGG
jgi:ABC-2 type transport system permease protein